MKEKTEWRKHAINTVEDRWEGLSHPEWVYFYDSTDLKWVNFYDRTVKNSFGQRAGQIIGDER